MRASTFTAPDPKETVCISLCPRPTPCCAKLQVTKEIFAWMSMMAENRVIKHSVNKGLVLFRGARTNASYKKGRSIFEVKCD
jgi:hypothetical protein